MSQRQSPHQRLAKQLKAARESHKIAASKVARALGVDADIIAVLEAGSIDRQLDTPFWVALYKQYGDYVGLDPSSYRASLNKALAEAAQRPNAQLQTSAVKPLFVLSQQLRRLLGTALTVVIVGYGYWQASALWSPPRLDLDWPTADTAVATDNPFVLSGDTSPEATLLIDGDPLPVDSDGSFATPIYLQQGRNLITIEVRNNVRGYQKRVLTLYPPAVDLQR